MAEPTAEIVRDERRLAPYVDQWDALAVARGRPFCQPAWMLSWWRAAREGDARLRVVLVHEDQRLIGVGPFFVQVAYGLAELRLLSAGFAHRIGPLAETGKEDVVAHQLALAIDSMSPTPASLVFEGTDAGDAWPERIAAAWPGASPRLRTDAEMDAPEATLDRDYEGWLKRRSRNFRKAARRRDHRLDEAGVQRKVAGDCDREAIATLLNLHQARWRDRGGSDVGNEAQAVIEGTAGELAGTGRMRVVALESPEGPVAAELVLLAGSTAGFWAGGFDPSWEKYGPGTQTMLLALRWAAENGADSADLGGGAHGYKLRLSDRNEPIVWRTVFPRGARYPLIRVRLAPKHLRQWLRRRPRPRKVVEWLWARRRGGS